MYEFTAVPVVQTVIAGGTEAERDTAVETALGTLLTGPAASRILAAPSPTFGHNRRMRRREFFGAPNMKAAEIEIEIDFWTDSSAC